MDASTPCGPDYAGYPLQQSIYPTMTNFSATLTSTVGNLANLASYFQQTFECTGPNLRTAVNSLRFQQSLFCSTQVQNAISLGCNPVSPRPSKGPLLCSATCTAAVNSLSSLVNDASSCPSNNAAPVRQSLVSRFQAYCDLANQLKSENNNQCTGGAQVEVSLCGWKESALAVQGCPNFPDDPCCGALNPIPSNNIGIIIGVVVGVFAILAAVGGYIFYVRRRRQHLADVRTLRNSFTFNVDSQGKFGSMAFFNFNSSERKTAEGPVSYMKSATGGIETAVEEEAAVIDMNNLPDGTKTMRVIHNYSPALADELQLDIGMQIVLLCMFDDGWALGYNPETRERGAFPLVCTEEITFSSNNRQSVASLQKDKRLSKRTSSLLAKNESNILKSLENMVKEDSKKKQFQVPSPSALDLPSSDIQSPQNSTKNIASIPPTRPPKTRKNSQFSKLLASYDAYDASLDQDLPVIEDVSLDPSELDKVFNVATPAVVDK